MVGAFHNDCIFMLIPSHVIKIGNQPTETSHCDAWLAGCRTTHCTRLVVFQSLGVDRLARLRLQVIVRKAKNLKTAGVTNDPKIQLVPFSVGGRDFHKARQTRLLFDGSIDSR